MALERLPPHLRSRRTAEAITAPAAVLAAGVGTSVAILAGAPLAGIVLAGALAWGAVVALRLPRRPRPLRGIDPKTLSDPWRRYVHEALGARRRFDEVVRAARSGPVRDRLAEIGTRVDAAVQECWRVARHGDALDDGIRSLDLAAVARRLETVRGTRPDSPGAAESWDRTVEALEAQLASGRRLVAVADDARRRLEVLDARLDEAVARAVELSLRAGDASELHGLGADVDQLVGDMEALRQGLEEVRSAQA
ncbi:MAG: hypothetical protein KatS3mg009_0087 [Acidimicrobiia bacterium]|nr:MAG: hypothetical protein KatS3mg009_0087 [Acidimicrobiia bacterium]